MQTLIRASAGSGKTFQLSGHFLKQLFLGQPPESILATTFTRKAAGEILGRVLVRLAKAAQDAAECQNLAEFLHPVEVTQPRAQQLLAELTTQLHRVRVCTLDSFFQQMARSLTLELGLPPGWNIIDEHTDFDLRQQAIDLVLAQQMPKDAQRLMQMLAKGHSKRSVRDLIDETVSKYYDLFLLTESDAWHRFGKRQRLTNDEIQRSIRELRECDLPADKRAEAARQSDVARFEAANWPEFFQKGLAGKIFQQEYEYYRKPMGQDLIEVYQRLIGHAHAELLHQISQQTKATHDLIARFDVEYSRLRSEHGWLRFNDVTRMLAKTQDATAGHRMSYRLDSSMRHLLLDEFQDTSLDQWQILRRFAVDIAGQAQQSSFFCVGDPKQAIYGWRGGVAEILDSVEETIPGVEAQSLDLSRRSSTPVIDTVNRVFQHVCEHSNLSDFQRACENWSRVFPKHSTANTSLPGFAQLRTSPFPGGENSEERRGPYYRWVAEQIRDLHEQSPDMEIGVLTRKNGTVARLVYELTLLGVPASEEGGTPPIDSPAILAVMSLLYLASHPGCTISRFHVCNSPLAGLVELTSWKDDESATASSLEIRNRLMDDGYGQTLQWVSDHIYPFCSQRDRMRMQQVVAEGWKYDRMPSLDPVDFIRLLENTRLSKSEVAPVRVMTVHQSKGLEFDVVVLPELDGKIFQPPSAAVGSPQPSESPDRVCMWYDKNVRRLLPVELQQAFEQTTAREVAESLCLLYVALTRAKNALHMLTMPVSAKQLPRTYAGLLVAALVDDHDATNADSVLFSTGNEFWYNDASKTHDADPPRQVRSPKADPARWHLAPLTGGRRRGLNRTAPSRHDDSRLFLPEPRRMKVPSSDIDARTRGTLFHAWFEQLHWLDQDNQPDPEQLREIAEELRVDETVASKLLLDFFELLEHRSLQSVLTKSGAAQSPGFRAHASAIGTGELQFRVENERPFVWKRDGCLVQGTIDRLVLLLKHGEPIAADILDYKTDRLSGQRSSWIRGKVEYYGPQLMEYRRAVSHCFRLPPENITCRLALLSADTVELA